MTLNEINRQIFDATGVEEWYPDMSDARRAIEGGALVQTSNGWTLQLPIVNGWQTISEICTANADMTYRHSAVIAEIRRMFRHGLLSSRFDIVGGIEIMELCRRQTAIEDGRSLYAAIIDRG